MQEWVTRFESARISRITLMPRLQLLNDPVTQAQPVEEVCCRPVTFLTESNI